MAQHDIERDFPVPDLTAVIASIPEGLAGLRTRALGPGCQMTEADHAALLDLAYAAETAMDAGMDARPDLDRLLIDVFYAEHRGPGEELGDAICRSGSLERIDPEFMAQ
jgi:hypothetical protein